MEAMALYAAPEFLYEGQHWSAHHLAPRLLQFVLAERSGETEGAAIITRVPETGLNSRNMQHGYQFHKILEEYSRLEGTQQ
mgnify:CR=1 FL=1